MNEHSETETSRSKKTSSQPPFWLLKKWNDILKQEMGREGYPGSLPPQPPPKKRKGPLMAQDQQGRIIRKSKPIKKK